VSLVLLKCHLYWVCVLWQALPLSVEDFRALLVATQLGVQQCPRLYCGPF